MILVLLRFLSPHKCTWIIAKSINTGETIENMNAIKRDYFLNTTHLSVYSRETYGRIETKGHRLLEMHELKN